MHNYEKDIALAISMISGSIYCRVFFNYLKSRLEGGDNNRKFDWKFIKPITIWAIYIGSMYVAALTDVNFSDINLFLAICCAVLAVYFAVILEIKIYKTNFENLTNKALVYVLYISAIAFVATFDFFLIVNLIM